MTRRTLIAVTALALAGCGSANKSAGTNETSSGGSASGAKSVSVAFVYPTTTTNFAQEMALGAKSAAEGRRRAVKLLIGNSNVEIGQDLAKALLPARC